MVLFEFNSWMTFGVEYLLEQHIYPSCGEGQKASVCGVGTTAIRAELVHVSVDF